MTAQLHLARGIVEGRIHRDRDRDLALLRNVQLAQQDERKARRAIRTAR